MPHNLVEFPQKRHPLHCLAQRNYGLLVQLHGNRHAIAALGGVKGSGVFTPGQDKDSRPLYTTPDKDSRPLYTTPLYTTPGGHPAEGGEALTIRRVLIALFPLTHPFLQHLNGFM